MTEAALKSLAEGLRSGRRITPDARKRDWLIHWLGGGGRKERETAEHVLGVAGDDPKILAAAYRGLDRVLFDNGRLSVRAAGLSGIDDESARRRYRQLIKVFHPDRFPDLSAWLTPRSQAIHDAYGRFKRGEAVEEDASLEHEPKRRPADLRRARVRDVGPLWPALMASWRARLGRVRNLPQKILVLVAVIALLPALNLYLVADGNGTGQTPAGESTASRGEVSAAGSVVAGPVTSGAAGVARDEAPWWYTGDGLREAADSMQQAETASEVVLAAAQETEKEEATEADEALAEEGEQLLKRWLRLLDPEFRPERPRARPDETGMDREALAELEEETRPRFRLPSLPEPPALPEDPEVAVISDEKAVPVAEIPEPDVLALLEGYRESIEQGDLSGFMSYFSSQPRENNNRGRQWFRENYGRLFRETEWRRFELDIENITRVGDEWIVMARYDMRISYPDNRQRTASGRTRYTIGMEAGDWMIREIEH